MTDVNLLYDSYSGKYIVYIEWLYALSRLPHVSQRLHYQKTSIDATFQKRCKYIIICQIVV